MTGLRKQLLLIGASVGAISSMATPAFAQDTSAEVDDQGPAPAEIVVTAQRREEALSRVPVSIQAFGAEELQQRAITSEQDLASLVPGLVVKNGQNSNQLSFSMRGQTLDPFSGTSPAVLPYLNEAPFTGGNTSTAFFDLASIQVLKGPQGTLFGRNATGGAVLYSTPMPGNEIGGFITGRFGERDLIQFQGAIDLPLIDDVLGVRLAGDFTQQDGYITNINTGNTLGDKDSISGRITVEFEPTDWLRNVTLFQFSDIDGTEGVGGLYSYYRVGQTNNGFALTSTLDFVYGPGSPFAGLVGDGPPGPGTWPGGPEGYLAFQRQNPFDVWLQYDLPHTANATFLSNTTEIDIGESMMLKNIFSYTDTFARTPGNLAGSPFGALWLFNFGGLGNGPPGGETFEIERWSDELQLQGDLADGVLEYIVGVFGSWSDQTDYIPVNVGADLPTPLADIAYAYTIQDNSKAIFGQLTYHVSDALTIAAGGRYTWEDVSISQNPLGIFGGVPDQSNSLDEPSWTLNLQYQISPEHMVYAAQRGSFRSGSFNGTVVPFNDVNFFDSETTYDFELGYKFNGFIGSAPVRFNIAAYQQIVEDAQHAIYAVIAGNPAGFTVNVPEATVRGVEVDGWFQPDDRLTLGFTLAYTDAEYTENIVDLSQLTGVPGYEIPFDSYPDSPKWAGTAFVQVGLPVPEDWGEMYFRVDGGFQSRTYFSNNNFSITPNTELPSYATVDLRYGWREIMGSGVSLQLSLTNATNEFYYISGFVMGAAGGYNTAIPSEPRTFAAELSFAF